MPDALLVAIAGGVGIVVREIFEWFTGRAARQHDAWKAGRDALRDQIADQRAWYETRLTAQDTDLTTIKAALVDNRALLVKVESQLGDERSHSTGLGETIQAMAAEITHLRAQVTKLEALVTDLRADLAKSKDETAEAKKE